MSAAADRPIDVSALLEQLMADDLSGPRRADLEAEMSATPAGREALVAWHRLLADAGAPPPGDLAGRVMAALPEVEPRVLRRVAEVVVEAWADPRLREALRADPRRVLAARGAPLPAELPAAVVAPSEARLPRADGLVLPLPEPSAPPVAADAARRQLAHGEFGWLWGTPWSQALDRAARPAAGAAPAAARGWRAALARLAAPIGHPWRGFAVAFVGVLALALAAVVAAPGLDGGGVSGAAVGGDGRWLIGAAVIAAVGGVLYWVARRQR